MRWLFSSITPLGWVIICGSTLCLATGWYLGWVEFVAVGLGGVMALLSALPFVLGGVALSVERSVDPESAQVGEIATSTLKITNTGRRTSPSRTITDGTSANRTTHSAIEIDKIKPGSTIRHQSPIPTNKRAALTLGPCNISKGDPLGVLKRTFSQLDAVTYFVHPRVVALKSVSAGFVKDLEGPTFDTSPAGDVAFHTIREYETGDDIRHIHWMSTARTGQLMIRHYVDNRRPYLGVIVDNRAASMSSSEFEIALEVAASHLSAALLEGRPVSIWVGTQEITTSTSPAERKTALDRLCLSEQIQGSQPIDALVQKARQADPDISAVLLISGSIEISELIHYASFTNRHVPALLARCRDSDSPPLPDIPNATTLDFSSVEEFAARWEKL